MDAKSTPYVSRAVAPAREAGRVPAWLVWSLILGAALALRLFNLAADAPTTLSWSGAPFTDEGLYSHAARNRVLFGVWRTDEWDNRLVSPLHDALAYLVFRWLGVGYVQLRLLSVLLAMVALAVFWRLLRVDLGERLALLGAALWGLDYFWLQFSRLGLLEPGMVAWLVIGAWLWRRSLDGGAAWALASGVAIGIAWVWKSLALLVVPAPLLALLLLDPAWPRRRVAAGYTAGLGAVLVVYGVAWFWPHRNELVAYQQFYAADRFPVSLDGLGQALGRNVRSPYVWSQTPVIMAVGVVGAGIAAGRAGHRALPPVVALSLAWVVCGLGLLLMPYSPPRYYTLVLPPLVCLAGVAANVADSLFSPRRPILSIGVLGLSLVWGGMFYMRWLGERQTTLPDSSRALGALVPPGELVLGVSACGLSLDNELRCAPPFAGLANDAAPVAALGAKYALVENNPDDYMRRFYGALLAEATPIRTLPFGRQRATLYRLEDPPTP